MTLNELTVRSERKRWSFRVERMKYIGENDCWKSELTYYHEKSQNFLNFDGSVIIGFACKSEKLGVEFLILWRFRKIPSFLREAQII